MEPGYIAGHEGLGVVHEVGNGVKKFKVGDRVIAPFLTSWYAWPPKPLSNGTILSHASSQILVMSAFTASGASTVAANPVETLATRPWTGRKRSTSNVPMQTQPCITYPSISSSENWLS
jgi:hypothetical protein